MLESRVLIDLTERGVAWAYESRKLAFTVHRTYTPDIVLVGANGSEMLIEVKGLFTGADRSKLLHVKKAHPDVDLRLVFQRSEQKLSRRSRTSYGGWCVNHGFPWAEGRVPELWLEELK